MCRRPQHERSERKRAEQRYAALERRIAIAPEGPELDAIARNVLSRGQLRFTRAVAMRLKAGSYELDAEGRAIIPPTLKPWADRLDVRQAESFCRHKLGLPRLPARRRYSGPATFAETARAIFRRFRADERLRKQQLRRTAALEDDLWPSEFDERPAPNEENRTGYRWTFEDERRFKADAGA